MSENMKKFLELASKDSATIAKVKALGKDGLVALAKELGITLTEADFVPADEGEISENELDTVTGSNSCFCVLGGGGTGSSTTGSKTCACVGAGVGLTEYGEGRCACAAADSSSEETFY